jgi:alkanesulfonate monooxygenase SsuD/methylene tetrahydromethanopterin reductase-like flavin-dependent oxidoreductase (luciferase family)
MRVGALLLPDAHWPELVRRAQRAERLGFDWVWVDDHAHHPADAAQPWMESWTALAGLAGVTARVVLGPLVANPVLRAPAVLARQARTLQAISGGRAEVALGSGYAVGDHAAADVPVWSPAERAERFAAAVARVDGLLSGDAWIAGGAVERPPLAVAAHGPRALELAARHADTWVSYGGFGLTPAQVLDVTARRGARLDAACTAIGRDPGTIRRRLLAGSAALTQAPLWRSPEDFVAWAAPLAAAGIDELALHFPAENVHPPGTIDPQMVERVAREAFPALRDVG